MRIKQITLRDYKRFKRLDIIDLPPTAKAVILVGPNGCGKSCVFDGFLSWQRAKVQQAGFVPEYHLRQDETANNNLGPKDLGNRSEVTLHSGPLTPEILLRVFHVRSAHRNEPNFNTQAIQMATPPKQLSSRIQRLIDNDPGISSNYQKLIGQTFGAFFGTELTTELARDLRDRLIGKVAKSISNVLPGLEFQGIGKPSEQGTFIFRKGAISRLKYQNLSAGEKAAFDVITDLVVTFDDNPDAIVCIDEPEVHMGVRVQRDLLREMIQLVPETGQLWIATHSVGMLREAAGLMSSDPGSVAFIDMGGKDFDTAQVLRPFVPTNEYWRKQLNHILEDLAALAAPRSIVLCEGSRDPSCAFPSFDARIYNIVFAQDFPEVHFVSVGSSHSVLNGGFGVDGVLLNAVTGISVGRLRDKDNLSGLEVEDYNAAGCKVLSRRNIECFLFDKEVIASYLESLGISDVRHAIDEIIQKHLADLAVRDPARQGDLKSVANPITEDLRRKYGSAISGSRYQPFALECLAPRVREVPDVYDELRACVFAPRP